jgi:spermidine synthase
MFDIKSVPKIVIREGSINNVSIVKNNTFYYLLVDNEQWMYLDTSANIQLREFYSSYDLAENNVLLSGWGFGILPQWIASKESVKSVTVVEKNKEVIDLFLLHNSINPKIKIVVSDIRKYHDNTFYDWAIFDHYELERVPTKEDFDLLSNNLNFKNLWFWSIEKNILQENSFQKVRQEFSIKIPNLSLNQVNNYMKTLFTQKDFLLE